MAGADHVLRGSGSDSALTLLEGKWVVVEKRKDDTGGYGLMT